MLFHSLKSRAHLVRSNPGHTAFISAAVLKDGTRLAVVGDAVIHFNRLSEERRQIHYWQRAIVTFNAAAKESLSFEPQRSALKRLC